MPQPHLAGAGITFTVDDVSPAAERLPELSSTRILEGALGGPIEACWAPERTLVGEEYPAEVGDEESLAGTEQENPLIFAVHLAFSQHRPLRLTPDAVWITLAQGFAIHIRQNAETLRRDLVDHHGKLLLTVTRRDRFSGVEGFPWAAAIDEFAAQIRERTGDLHDLVICDFSTTGPAERTASQIVLMDAVTPYFDYGVRGICGIPRVTLEGTPADWEHLEEKARRLAHYGLGWWTERLLPICAELARSAKGEIDLEFWRRIYKRRDAYGGDIINGWIAELFPFIKDPMTDQITEINPIFTTDKGVRSSRIPRGLTRVPFACDLGAGERDLELIAGLVGVAQDPETLSLRPEVGWAVREGAEVDSVLRRLLALPDVALERPATRADLDGDVRRPGEPWEKGPDGLISENQRIASIVQDLGMPADLVRFYSATNGAVLFGAGGSGYRIRSAKARCPVEAPPGDPNRRALYGGKWFRWIRFCDLADGSFLAYRHRCVRSRTPRWSWTIAWFTDEIVARTGEAPIVAESFTEFLSRAISGGEQPYFAAADFVSPGSISLAES